MARVPPVSEIIQEIREQSDETSQVAKSDEAICRIMTRGVKFISGEIAKNWPDLLIAVKPMTPDEYDVQDGIPPIPDAFQDRITLVQFWSNQTPVPVPMRGYNEVSGIDSRRIATMIPLAWYMSGRNIKFAPACRPAYPWEIHYVRRPDPLVVETGRINTVGDQEDGADYVICDELRLAQIATQADDRKSCVNIIDGLTGDIKCTMQVANIQGNKVTFRTAPQRQVFDGRQVVGQFPDKHVPVDGDYICPASGTCVPQFNEMFNDYVTQYAVAEIGRSLGDNLAQISLGIAKRAEEVAAQQRSGRPAHIRVKNRSSVWSLNVGFRTPRQERGK